VRRSYVLIGRVIASVGIWVFVVGVLLLLVSLPGQGAVFSRPLFEIALVPLLVGGALTFIPPTVWWLSAITRRLKRRRAYGGDMHVAGILERCRALNQHGSQGADAMAAIADRDRGYSRLGPGG
jgi:hypothetical protein